MDYDRSVEFDHFVSLLKFGRFEWGKFEWEEGGYTYMAETALKEALGNEG